MALNISKYESKYKNKNQINFSKTSGPFSTTVITDGQGKQLGHIRRVGDKAFLLTSQTKHLWKSQGIVKGSKTNCQVFPNREDAISEAKRVL